MSQAPVTASRNPEPARVSIAWRVFTAPLFLGLPPVDLPRTEPALLQVHTRYFALKVDLTQFCGALRLVKSEASIARGLSS